MFPISTMSSRTFPQFERLSPTPFVAVCLLVSVYIFPSCYSPDDFSSMSFSIRLRRPATPFSDFVVRLSPCSANPFARHRRAISIEALDQTKGDRERVVILGSGWAGQSARTLPKSPENGIGRQNTDMEAPNRLHAVAQALRQEIPNPHHLSPLLLRLHPPPQQHRCWHSRIPHRPRTHPLKTSPPYRVHASLGRRC